MFTTGLILGMAIGALVAIIFMMVIMAQIVKQNGAQKNDIQLTNAAAREYWNFMTDEINSQTFALRQISLSLRELAKIPPTVGEASDPKCDACGMPITEDQQDVGHECNLHQGCAKE